jgi:predicted alpha/beta hydrolase family esterase
MTNYYIVPGLGNSEPEHWQSFFERSGNNFQRIQQTEWEAPDCTDWITNIDNAIKNGDLSNTVLIGHSLGCATIAHWAATYQRKIKGALLVAPSDLEAPQYTFPTTGFAPIPLSLLPFRSIVVASTNDVWVSMERARFFADQWGSELINIGDAGHINSESGHTDWTEGLAILKRLD